MYSTRFHQGSFWSLHHFHGQRLSHDAATPTGATVETNEKEGNKVLKRRSKVKESPARKTEALSRARRKVQDVGFGGI